MNTNELKKALMWGIGLGLGFAVASYVLGTVKKL